MENEEELVLEPLGNDQGLDLVVCPDCEEPFCLTHGLHYSDCECPGLHGEDED